MSKMCKRLLVGIAVATLIAPFGAVHAQAKPRELKIALQTNPGTAQSTESRSLPSW